MTDLQFNIIIVSFVVLITTFTFTLNWIFLVLGKKFWNYYLPKLPRTSKLRFKIIEEIRNGQEEMLYVLTSIAFSICFCLFSGILWLIIKIGV